MGTDTVTPQYFGIGIKTIVTKTAQGTCPMCNTSFELHLESEDGYFEPYKCPCGYFALYFEPDSVIRNNSRIPKEEWQRRLAAKLAGTQ
jgi:hypothetical protein